MQWLKKLRIDPKLMRHLATITYMPYYQDYLVLGEDIHATFPFKIYYTLWPKDLSLKSTWKKWRKDEHEGLVEEHASSHVEDVCIEEGQTKTHDTPL